MVAAIPIATPHLVMNNGNNCFRVVTYNMFAKSLGTNTIPWVMNVSPAIQSKIEESTSLPFSMWVEQTLKPEYFTHFHKNFHSGNYATMRGFWGAPTCEAPSDVPSDLLGISWHGSDSVSYHTNATNQTATDNEEPSCSNSSSSNSSSFHEVAVATTLKGVAKRSLPDHVFQEFFTEVISAEEHIYAWPVRGPRIFRTLTRPTAPTTPTPLSRRSGGGTSVDSHCSGSSGAQEQAQEQEQLAPLLKPDIISLSEYDCHHVFAEYREKGLSETFASAMAAEGYQGIFLKDPLPGRDPPSGLGLFWNEQAFSPIGYSDNGNNSKSSDNTNGMLDLECNHDAFSGNACNRDLNETWHPIQPAHAIAGTPNDDESHCNSTTNCFQQSELMKASDRRNAGLVRLLHTSTGRTLTICTAHLMTTSRDSSKTNRYPGEVRAGELAAVKQLISEKAEPNDAVLFMGDLNTDAQVCQSIFGGKIGCVGGGGGGGVAEAAPQKDGNNKGVSSQLSRVSPIVTSDRPIAAYVEFDTGFNLDTKEFTWGNHQLRDTFASVHQWGKGVGEGKNCTSRNAVRIEWIDYMFHTANLRSFCHSDCRTPKETMPDEEHPSDHLPLGATFEFI